MLKLKLEDFANLMQSANSGKHRDTGKDWGQKEKRVTEEEKDGQNHQFNGHVFEQTMGNNEREGGLVCCSPGNHKRVGYYWIKEQQQSKYLELLLKNHSKIYLVKEIATTKTKPQHINGVYARRWNNGFFNMETVDCQINKSYNWINFQHYIVRNILYKHNWISFQHYIVRNILYKHNWISFQHYIVRNILYKQ